MKNVSRDGIGTRPTLPVFRRVARRLCIALVTCATVSCVRRLPPSPIPAPVPPPIAAAPPPPGGHGRLVVDVVEGQVPVQRIKMAAQPIQNGTARPSYALVEAPEVMCALSPCATDVPTGNVLLGFPVIGKPDAREVELVHVGPDPSVYRRSLSVYENHTGGMRNFGIVATSVGGAALVTGTVLLPIGLAKDIDGMTMAGGISLGVGAAVLAYGIWAIWRYAPTYRPGSSNHFPLAAQ